jgi:hypothetical protein
MHGIDQDADQQKVPPMPSTSTLAMLKSKMTRLANQRIPAAGIAHGIRGQMFVMASFLGFRFEDAAGIITMKDAAIMETVLAQIIAESELRVADLNRCRATYHMGGVVFTWQR